MAVTPFRRLSEEEKLRVSLVAKSPAEKRRSGCSFLTRTVDDHINSDSGDDPMDGRWKKSEWKIWKVECCVILLSFIISLVVLFWLFDGKVNNF